MQIFGSLYKKVISWVNKKNAHKYLFCLSFSESSFFPIPPDVMLIPMCLANRKKVWFYATLTTIASLLGGIFGYILGFFTFDIIDADSGEVIAPADKTILLAALIFLIFS